MAKSLEENPFRDMEFAAGADSGSRPATGDNVEKPRSDSARNRSRSKDKGKEKARDRSSRPTTSSRANGSGRGSLPADGAGEKNSKEASESDRRGRRPAAPSPPGMWMVLVGGLVLSLVMGSAGIYMITKGLSGSDTPKQAPAAQREPSTSKAEDDLPAFQTNVPALKPKDNGGGSGS